MTPLAAGLALLLFAPQDSVRVQSSLTASRIAAGGSTALVIQVETGGEVPDDVPVPTLPPGLTLGRVSDFSQLQVAFPGGRRRITRREIVIRANEPGVYRIPAISVTIARRTYRTAALQLTVGGETPAGAGAPPAGAVRLRAWVRPDTVFVGQQVLFQVEAVFPEALRLRQARPPAFSPPLTTGFWTFDLPEPVTVSLRMLGGEAVEVQDFRQVLFPLAAGTYRIPPAQLQYELRQGLANTPEVRTMATSPLTVHVLPLPPGAPPDFAEAVGSYRLESALSTARTAVGEPVTLRVTVAGSGNLKTLARPALPAIPEVSAYPAEEPVTMSFADDRVSGHKSFDWTLVPQAPGRLQVPGLRFAWFDPDSRSYHTARTGELLLEVTPVAAASSGGELAPLRPSPARDLAWVFSPAFALAQLLPPLGFLAAILARRRRGSAGSMAAPPRELQRAAALLNDSRACLEELAIWLARQPQHGAVTELRSRVRHALYAPTPADREECERLLEAARQLAHPGAKLNSHVWTVTLLALATVAPAAIGPFDRGIEAYRAADYRGAASAFAEHLAGSPADAAAWYNLGNSWAALDDSGRATWAWLRALELAPRDPAARHNLAVAGTGAGAGLAPRVPFSSAEVAVLAALLWWLSWALGWLAWKRGHGWRPAALAAVVLLFPALALLASRELRLERALVLAPTAVQSAPAQHTDVLQELPPGTPLLLLGHREHWILVRTPDLREGWVAADQLGRLGRSGPSD